MSRAERGRAERGEAWREHERAWAAAPGDQAVLQALITARQRAGLEVPGALLDEQVFPARAFASERPWEVWCQLPARRARRVGETPGELTLPRHRAWWVQPPEVEALDAARLREVAAGLNAEAIPGVSLRGAALENRHLAPLGQATGLTRVILDGCARLTGPALEHLAGCAGLVHLSLERCGRVTGGLRNLTDTALRSLNAVGVTWTSTGYGALEALTGLTRARVGGGELAAETLHTLAQLPQLARLELPRSHWAGPDLRRLQEAPALLALDLSWSRVQSSDVAIAAGCPQLRELHMAGCPGVQGSALDALAGCASLRVLTLRACEGIDNKALPALRGLTQLTRLDVSGTKLTKTRVASLRKALPDCDVLASV